MYGTPPQGGFGNYGMQGYPAGYAPSPQPGGTQPTEFAVQERRNLENQVFQAPETRERVSSRNKSAKAEAVANPPRRASLPNGNVVSTAHQPAPVEPGLGKLLGLKNEPKKWTSPHSARPFGMSLW